MKKSLLKFQIGIIALFPFISYAETMQEDNDTVISIENPIVGAYMKDVIYDDNDYSYTLVTDYASIQTDYRKDQPVSYRIFWNRREDTANQRLLIVDSLGNEKIQPLANEIQSYDVSNLIPNRKYKISVVSVSNEEVESELLTQEIRTTGQLRMIKCNSLINVRDIGGWKGALDKPIKYNKIIRGGALNQSFSGTTFSITDEDTDILLDNIGITAEIDLGQTGATESPLGTGVRYVALIPARWNYFGDEKELTQRRSIETVRKIIELLKDGHAIYLHCFGGADRTGVAIATIEALLGVSESDIMKDYELTSFSTYGMRARNTYSSDYPAFKCLPVIKLYEGNTLSEKWINYLKEGGLQDNEIEELRTLLLEDYSPSTQIIPIRNTIDKSMRNKSVIFDISGKEIAYPMHNQKSHAVLIINGKKKIMH